MSERRSLLATLLRRPSSVLSLMWLLLLLVAAAFPRLLTHVDPNGQDLSNSLSGPSRAHVLGSDTFGQDIYARLVHGTRPTLIGLLIAVSIALTLGVTLGLLAGFLGGWVDVVISRFAEILFSIPGLLILLVVYAVFPYNVAAGMGTFGVLLSSGLMRLVRGITLGTKEELFVAAAQVSGLSRAQIIARHLFPRVKAILFVQAALLGAFSILVQSGLAFLGFAARPPRATWGGMVAEARSAMIQQNWLLVPSGAVIALTVFSLSVLGDALRDQSTALWAPSKLKPRRRKAPPQGVAQSPPIEVGASLLAVRHLSVAFQGDTGAVEVVGDVSFDIAPGETLGVVGESGCGKSVTATAILGMIPGTGEITAGQCWFEGRDLTTLAPDGWASVRGKRIGFVSQEPMVSLDPTFRVGSQLAEIVRRHHGCSKADAKRRTLELLEAVNLPDPTGVAAKFPHQMSGGMAQRIAIAYALAGDPVLLIADEPTTALDVTVQAEILALLRRLGRERNMAVMLITHNWGVVADLCDRAVVMYAGQVVESARVGELFHDARHPYTTALLHSNPSLATPGHRLPAIGGTVPAPADWPVGCHFADRCPHVNSTCTVAAIALDQPVVGREVRCVRADELRGAAA